MREEREGKTSEVTGFLINVHDEACTHSPSTHKQHRPVNLSYTLLYLQTRQQAKCNGANYNYSLLPVIIAIKVILEYMLTWEILFLFIYNKGFVIKTMELLS